MKLPENIYEPNSHSLRSNTTLIKTKEQVTIVPLNCANATSFFSFSTRNNNMNYLYVRYNIIVDGVDYGEHDLHGIGSIRVGEVTLNAYVDSSGNGSIYCSTNRGSDIPKRFEFVPRSDMKDANIYSVDIQTNPTLLYNPKNRSVRVCLTSQGNA